MINDSYTIAIVGHLDQNGNTLIFGDLHSHREVECFRRPHRSQFLTTHALSPSCAAGLTDTHQ